MKKRGFTLIELLAVIVVLAIIALIATPTVMNVIKKANAGAAERSADNYLKAVETAIAADRLEHDLIVDGTYIVSSDGNLCLEGKTCAEPDLKVEVSGDYPTGGAVTIANGQIVQDATTNVIVGSYEVTYDENKKLYATLIVPFCQLEEGEAYAIGSKYTCNPGTGDETFYVLESNDERVSLILNRDVGSSVWCINEGSSTSDFDTSCAAAEAKRVLAEKTTEWTTPKIKSINLPTAAQVSTAINTTSNDSWIVEGSSGLYWTSTASGGSQAYAVRSGLGGSASVSAYYAGSSYGIRPVITVVKDNL